MYLRICYLNVATQGQMSFFSLIHFNYTSPGISLCLTFFFTAEHASRMCGKHGNTIEHQANYVAVNYSLATQVCKVANTCRFLFSLCL